MINFVDVEGFFHSLDWENVICFYQVVSVWQVKIICLMKHAPGSIPKFCVFEHFVTNYKAAILIWTVDTTISWIQAHDYCNDIPVNLGKITYFDKA